VCKHQLTLTLTLSLALSLTLSLTLTLTLYQIMALAKATVTARQHNESKLSSWYAKNTLEAARGFSAGMESTAPAKTSRAHGCHHQSPSKK
jgi:hypothetical protein